MKTLPLAIALLVSIALPALAQNSVFTPAGPEGPQGPKGDTGAAGEEHEGEGTSEANRTDHVHPRPPRGCHENRSRAGGGSTAAIWEGANVAKRYMRIAATFPVPPAGLAV